MWYKDYFNRFVEEVNKRGMITFNSFDGKADMQRKQYLPDLTTKGYPVIPTVDRVEDTDRLGPTDLYIVKLKDGADSIGMNIMSAEELFDTNPEDRLIQPLIDFRYEVSFYYLDNRFQYALYAPDKFKRWDRQEYEATAADHALPNSSSGGTTWPVALCGWTPAASRTAPCCWWSWKTSTPFYRSQYSGKKSATSSLAIS